MSQTAMTWGIGFIAGWLLCTCLYELMYMRERDKIIRALTKELLRR